MSGCLGAPGGCAWFACMECMALISLPKRWVAKPKLQISLLNTRTRSSGITSRFVSEKKEKKPSISHHCMLLLICRIVAIRNLRKVTRSFLNLIDRVKQWALITKPSACVS